MNEEHYPAETSAENVKVEKLPYSTEITRVHRKTYAKNGHVFIVIKHKNKNSVYSNSLQVPFGLTKEQQSKVADSLWSHLSLKYGL